MNKFKIYDSFETDIDNLINHYIENRPKYIIKGEYKIFNQKFNQYMIFFTKRYLTPEMAKEFNIKIYYKTININNLTKEL